MTYIDVNTILSAKPYLYSVHVPEMDYNLPEPRKGPQFEVHNLVDFLILCQVEQNLTHKRWSCRKLTPRITKCRQNLSWNFYLVSL